jgi:hypothetical protein
MENSPQVTVEVKLKPNDVSTPFDWTFQNLFRWVVAAVIAYAVYDVCFSAGQRLESLPDAESIKAVLVTLAIFIVLGLVLFPYLRLVASIRKNHAFRKVVSFTLTSDGVQLRSEDAKGDYKWTLFTHVFETKKAFVLSQGGYGTYLPKRCFASSDDINAVRQLIRDNFKGKWRLRRD